MTSCASNQPLRRLGTRVRAQIPVRITSLDPAISFSENCHTLQVNPQGCGIRCSRPLTPGLQIRMDELPGRGTAIAKVAGAQLINEESKFWIVGIALETPGNLWCIVPAPLDWGVYAPPAKFAPSSLTNSPNYLLASWLNSEIRSGKA